MGIVVRQSIKASVGFYLGVVLGAINTLYFSTKFLETDQLATSRLLLENGLIYAAFTHLGATNICDRYLMKYKNKELQNNGILLFLLLIGLIGCSIFGIFFFIFRNDIINYYQQNSPSFAHQISLCVPITLSWTFFLILETYIKGHQRVAIPTFIKETLLRLINIFLVILLGLGYINFQQFLYLFVGSIVLITLILVAYCWHLGHFYFSFKHLNITKQDKIEMLKYGSFLIIGGIGVNLIFFLDRNILASEVGPTAVAIFVISSYIASIIEIPSKSLKQISTPLLAQSIAQNDIAKTKELYLKVATNSMLVGGILLILIFSNLNTLLSILPKAEIYKNGFWVIVIIGTCKWVDMSLGLNAELIAFSKYFKFNTYLVVCLAIIAIFLNYLLIPYFGVMGSALATGLVTILSSVSRLAFSNNKFNIQPFSVNTFKIIGVLLLMLLLGNLIPNFGHTEIWKIIFMAIKSSIILFVFIVISLQLKLSQDLNNFKNTIFKTIKLKI